MKEILAVLEHVFPILAFFTIIVYYIKWLFIRFKTLRKYKLKEEYYYHIVWPPSWYEFYEVNKNSEEFMKDDEKIQKFCKQVKFFAILIFFIVWIINFPLILSDFSRN